MSTYDEWKLASPPEYERDDEPVCDRIGCGAPAERWIREHEDEAFLCGMHAAECDEVPVGGSSGCAGGCQENAPKAPSKELTK